MPGVTESTALQIDIHRLQQQDAAAFTELVHRHQNIVMGLGQSLGLRGADLDDAAAEVFANVYRSLPKFAGRSSVGTWLYQIAFRTLRRYRTKLRRRPTAPESTTEPVADKDASPPQAFLDREQRERLWDAVAKLEPRQAMAIELCYRRSWSVEQIAETMECPQGTIKTLLYRARQQLKIVLDDDKP